MQPKLWPDLAPFGAQLGILVRQEDGRSRPAGLALTFTQEPADVALLERHGFAYNVGRKLWQRDDFRIEFVALAAIFPGFDPDAHLSTQPPVRYPLEPAGAESQLGEVGAASEPESGFDHAVAPGEPSGTAAADLGYQQPRRARGDTERIEDFGEKIGGAKKDTRGKGGRRVFTREEFTDRTQKQLADDLSLTKLWPFSFQMAKEQGMSVRMATWVMGFRRELAAFSKLQKSYVLSGHNRDEAALAYAQAVTILAEAFSRVRTVEDYPGAFNDMRTRLIEEGHIEVAEVPSFYNSSRMSKQVSYETKVGNLIGTHLVGRHFRFDFFEECRAETTPRGYDFAADKQRLYRYEDADTEAQWAYLLGKSKRGPVQKREGPAIPDRPHLDSIVYEGFPLRREGDVSVEEFASAFAFRAVEFGEWLPQNERQAVLNMAYDALMTQAEIMGVSPRMMSLEGRLAAAFGSRGNGGRRSAAAHYEPSKKVFNLTRINGAGSLAHEYAHALDHWMQDLVGTPFGRELGLGLSDWSFTGRFPKGTDPVALSGASRIADALETAQARAARAIERNGPQTEEAMLPAALLLAHKMAGAMEQIKVAQRLPTVEERLEQARRECAFRLDQAALWAGNCAPFKSRSGRYDQPRKIVAEAVARHQRMADAMFGGEYILNEAYPDSLLDAVEEALAKEGFRAPRIAQNIRWNLRRASDAAAKVMFLEQPEELRAKIAAHSHAYAELLAAERVDSPFVQQAKKLDGERSSPYWGEPHELFARAFESWMFDEIQQKGRADYLVHGVEESRYGDSEAYAGNPYPSGEQRQVINAAMNELMGEIGAFVRARNAWLSLENATVKKVEMAV